MRRGRRALLLALMLTVCVAPAANASCPPKSGSGNWLERFVAARAAGGGPGSDAELQAWLVRENVPPIELIPSTGPAPLAAQARWIYYPVADPEKVEFDVGDGRTQTIPGGYGLGRIEHTYDRPGRYEFRVWVHERGGAVRRYGSAVEVVSRAAFESEIQSRWHTFKARLAAGDVTSALECLHSSARARYEPQLKQLFGGRQTPVDDVLTAISFVKVFGGDAEFQIFRPRDAQTLTYSVHFTIDGDGVWRLRSF